MLQILVKKNWIVRKHYKEKHLKQGFTEKTHLEKLYCERAKHTLLEFTLIGHNITTSY